MIHVNQHRIIDLDGIAADSVNDLLAVTKGSGRYPEAIKLSLSIHNATGSRIVFTTEHWLRHFRHMFGDFFEERGINLSAPSDGIKPARYDVIYADETARYSGGKWAK